MWTPEERRLVGDYGAGQALSDDQYRLIKPLLPPAEARRSSPQHGHAPTAGRPVLCGADRLLTRIIHQS